MRFKEKVNNVTLKAKSRFVVVPATCAIAITTATTAMAMDSDSASVTISAALQSGLNAAVNDFVGYVAVVLPIGITVFGTVFGVKKAKAFFNTVAK